MGEGPVEELGISAVAAPAPEVGGTRRVRAWFRVGVEAFSLLASLAFLVAVTLNEIIFRRWGLSFLQVASPSDVVMAGLGALFYSSPVVLLAGLGALLGWASRRVRPLWWGLLLLECGLVAVLGARIGADKGPGAALTTLLILALVPLAHLLTHRRRQEVLSRRAAAVAVAVLVAGAVLAIVADQVETQAGEGVNPRRIHVLQPVVPGCHGVVLWQGERATVVECAHGETLGKDVRVLYNAENLVVTTGAAPHPPAAGAPGPRARDPASD